MPDKKARQADLFINVCLWLNLDLFKDQGTVSSAKTKGVAQSVLQIADLARFMRHEVQIATFIRVIQINGWRNGLIAQRQNRENRLYQPAAPNRWPVIDLVELTITRLAASPKTDLTACVSALSPAGVDVPCALT